MKKTTLESIQLTMMIISFSIIFISIYLNLSGYIELEHFLISSGLAVILLLFVWVITIFKEQSSDKEEKTK